MPYYSMKGRELLAEMMKTAILRRPKFDLRFITETSEYHIVTDTATPENNFMTESVVNITTKNNMDDDSSAFSVLIAGDMQWDKILNSNDMMILKIEPNELTPKNPGKEDKVKNNTLIVGLVSEVRLEGSYAENSRMYRITGQSLAKAFIQFELRTIQQISFPMTTAGWMDSSVDGLGFTGDLMGKNVADTVNIMLDRFMEYMKYYFNRNSAENTQLQTRIERSISSWEDDEMLTDPIPFTSYEGSFNQLLSEIVTRPFCEMFFDVYSDAEGNEKAKFVVRRTPFDKDDWYALPQHQLSTRDVINESVAQSDLDAYAIFNIVPENSFEASLTSIVRPKFHPSLVEKYGYKMLQISHKYLSSASLASTEDTEGDTEETTDSGASTNLINVYSTRLYDWYVLNPNFFSGEIRVIGHPDYRLGNRLLYADPYNNDIWEYYIESVEQNFSYTDGYTTTLGVTRGLRLKNAEDDGGRFNPPTGEPQDFKGGYLGEMSIATIEAAKNSVNVNIGLGQNSGDSGGQAHGIVTGDPSDKARKAADFGLQFVNNASGSTAYHWGGGRQASNPLLAKPPYKLDCSSYVYWCFEYAGVKLANGPTSHTTFTIRDTSSLYTIGEIGSGIKPANLTYGDLVFFNGDNHIGIYVGNGEFIAFNGSGTNNYAKGCEKKSMTTGYWKDKFEGHVMRY